MQPWRDLHNRCLNNLAHIQNTKEFIVSVGVKHRAWLPTL